MARTQPAQAHLVFGAIGARGFARVFPAGQTN